jgi:hypothetical protein
MFVNVPQVDPEQPGELSLVPSLLRTQMTPSFEESFCTVALTFCDPPVATEAASGDTDTVIVCPNAAFEYKTAMSRNISGIDRLRHLTRRLWFNSVPLRPFMIFSLR